MALLDPPQAGTGKPLLSEIVSILATGRAGEMFFAPRDNEEWRKQITIALMSGTPLVAIDNMTVRLDNPDLCKVSLTISIGGLQADSRLLAFARKKSAERDKRPRRSKSVTFDITCRFFSSQITATSAP